MVDTDINKLLGKDSFEYGNHIIEIEVRLQYKYIWEAMNISNRRQAIKSYCRVVTVTAFENNEKENSKATIENETKASLDATPKPKLFGDNKIEIPTIEEQIKKTVQPIFQQLDELYTWTQDAEINIDVAIQEVSAETSWVEIENEVERLSHEIDELNTA